MGARVAIADALDAERLRTVVAEVSPSHVVHLLTALPPAGPMRPRDFAGDQRAPDPRHRHLVRAVIDAGASRLVAESFIDRSRSGFSCCSRR